MVKEKLTVKSRTVTVAAAASEAKSVRFVDTEKHGYRVMEDGKIGIYGSTGKSDDEAGWKRAEENLKNEIPYPVEPSKNRTEHIDASHSLLSDKEFVEKTKELLAKLKEKCPTFLFSNNILKGEIEECIGNDVGLDLSYKAGFYSLDLIMKEKSSANIFDLGYSYSGKSFDVEKMTKDIEELAQAYYVAADIGEGEHYVLASVYDLAVNKLYEGIRADSYANGTGLFAGKCGQQVFDECVTIYEDRDPNAGVYGAFFDDEGVVNEGYKNVVFEKGVFKGPLASKFDAQKYGLPASGSASSAYDGVPQTGMGHLRVAGSGKTIRELIGDEKAIYLVMASGGDTTPDGDFATPVQVAFLYEKGKLVGRLPALNVSGNLFDIYGKNFVGQAEDSLSATDCESYKPLVVKMKVTK